jgi:hypothetical protein
LRKVLPRFDVVSLAAAPILVLASIVVAAQAITGLAISLVLFRIPYGILVAEPLTAFPRGRRAVCGSHCGRRAGHALEKLGHRGSALRQRALTEVPWPPCVVAGAWPGSRSGRGRAGLSAGHGRAEFGP